MSVTGLDLAATVCLHAIAGRTRSAATSALINAVRSGPRFQFVRTPSTWRQRCGTSVGPLMSELKARSKQLE